MPARRRELVFLVTMRGMHCVSAACGLEMQAVGAVAVVTIVAVMPAIDVSRCGHVMPGIRDDRRRAVAGVSDHRGRNDNGRRSDNARAVIVMIVPQRNAEADPRTRLRRSRQQACCNCTKEQ